jgi:thymidylate synthase
MFTENKSLVESIQQFAAHFKEVCKVFPTATDYVYGNLLAKILSEGKPRQDRTGVGTIGIFGHQLRFDLSESFPLITTKKVAFKSVITELLWFIRGDTDVKFLHDHGCTIWDEWTRMDGSLGPIYGHQWMKWETRNGKSTNQLQEAIRLIKTDPTSRRIVVSAWNVADLPYMALMPCHILYQFYVEDGRLSCHMYQRSADCFLGVPFNIASYALLTHLVAKTCDLQVGDLIISLGDAHIYSNHILQVVTQLGRDPKLTLPKLEITQKRDIEQYDHSVIKLTQYDPHPHIKGEVAV